MNSHQISLIMKAAGFVLAYFVAVHCFGADLTFHCSLPCKVYIDGQLATSLQSDGVRIVQADSKKPHTILITRHDKSPWVYKISSASDLMIDPDISAPKEIPKTGSSGQEQVALAHEPLDKTAGRSDVADKLGAPRYPDWLATQGAWGTGDGSVDTERVMKPITLHLGSVSCPAVEEHSVRIERHLSGPGFTLDFDHDINPPKETHNNSVCFDSFGEYSLAVFDAWVKIEHESRFEIWKTPMIVTHIASDSVSFEVDLSKCISVSGKPCKLPGELRSASGQIFPDSNGIKVVWGGDLDAEGTEILKARD